MSQPRVSESGLLARLAARAADLAERGQPDFAYFGAYTGASLTATSSLTNSAYYTLGTTGTVTLDEDSLASVLAGGSFALGWTFAGRPTYSVAPAFAQATYTLAASASTALSDYPGDAPQGAVIHEHIRLAVDMLLTELSARIDDACQHGNAGAAEHQNQPKPPELAWAKIAALIAALALLLALLTYFFPPS